MIVTVAGLKGGTGKTTVAVSLAEAAAKRHGTALLVDADPQGSAMTWAELADEIGEPLLSATVALPTRDLARRLEAIGAGRYALVVVDTPPGDARITASALAVADLVLIPARPTAADMSRLWPTLEAVAAAGKAAAVVLSQVRVGTRGLAAAAQALATEQQHLAETLYPQREAIAACFGRRPTGVLAEAGRDLLDEIEKASER
jgi:chromosome partitioning protein